MGIWLSSSVGVSEGEGRRFLSWADVDFSIVVG